MIFDKKANLKTYWGINQNLDIALNYMESHDLEALATGRYDVDGDNVYVLIQEKDTRPAGVAKWEGHKNYIDIQYLLKGAEMLGSQDADALKVSVPYNPEKDILFFEDNGKGSFLHARPGDFAVFFPTDAHMPLRAENDQPAPVKKAVIKVKCK